MASTTATSNQTSANATTLLSDKNHSDIFRKLDETYNDPLRVTDPDLFQHLQDLNLDQLNNKNLTPILPFLVKLFLNPYFTERKNLLRLIYPYRKANDMLQLFQTKSLESQDLNIGSTRSPEPSTFESGDSDERIKLVALEFIGIQDIARQSNMNANPTTKLQGSPLFDNPLYVEDIVLCLFTLLNKSTTIPVMNIIDASEALIHLKYGPTYIMRLVTNMPDRCHEVCQSLITFGENQDECEKINDISDQRAKTLRALCQLNPTLALSIRSLTLQLSKMPSLTIMITLDRLIKSMDSYKSVVESQMDDNEDSINETAQKQISLALIDLESSFDSAISFITGILLGVDEKTRTWFAQYIRTAQQKRIDQNHHTILSAFRSLLLTYVQKLFPCFLESDYLDPKTLDSFKVDQSESSSEFLNRKLIKAIAILRFYCALRGIGMLKLYQEENETLLRLVTCRQAASQTSINFATTGVCTLLVCSSMINNQKDEKRAAEWLKWLIKESHYSDDSLSNHGKCSISELLLLIAIHFQNNHTNLIAELVHATLGIKLQARFTVSKCKSLFVQEVFTDQMIAEHAVRVPVTKGLDNSIKEFLPIHCIHQLLESRSFSKHQVPIEDWIFKQICESKKPIHHMLPELISAYVNSIMISNSIQGHCGTNQPLSEAKISQIYQTRLYSLNSGKQKTNIPITNGSKSPSIDGKKKKKVKKEKSEVDQPMDLCDDNVSTDVADDLIDLAIVDMEVAQILLLYYLLLYEEVRVKEICKQELSVEDRAKFVEYGPELMTNIPIFYLLQLVRDNPSAFGTILPPLLRLVATQYPHLCSIQHWLNTTNHYEPYKSKDVSNKISETSSDQVCLRYKHSSPKDTNSTHQIAQMIAGFDAISDDPTRLAKMINSIAMLPRDEIWVFVEPFICNWTKILNLEQTKSPQHAKLLQLITKLWWKLNTVFPSKLWVMTVNSLRIVQNGVKTGSIKSLEYSWNELITDPLIVLRCDSRVFRNPEYLNILLHILDAFLAASRRSLHEQLCDQLERLTDQSREKSLRELKTTLVLAQTSAAIQILLESCLPTDEEQELLDKKLEISEELTDEDKRVLDRFDASVSCICEHLHQVFIADTNLAKLVHFQTYSSELLATTSDKIPSMHICLDFIPELLAQPDSSKQVFVIELTSHLCGKYAITKSLNVAKLCFNVAYTLLQLLPSERRALFYIPALPALLRICKVFPILQEDARIILNQINQISLAHIASTSSRLSLGTAKPFEGLDKMSWIEVRKLMNSLNNDEALYVCIQKCMLDLDQMEENDKQQVQQLLTQNGHEKHSQPAYNTIFAYGSHVTNC